MQERGLKYHIERLINCLVLVAPYAGAWIEICLSCSSKDCFLSLLMQERGLKCSFFVVVVTVACRSLCRSVD